MTMKFTRYGDIFTGISQVLYIERPSVLGQK